MQAGSSVDVDNAASRLGDIAFTGRVLGALFYYPPDSPQAATLIAELAQGDWCWQWPFGRQRSAGVDEKLNAALAASARQIREGLMPAPAGEETLAQAWQRLFIGPWALPAPPWGSVWLDREKVVFGESMVQLRQWLRQRGIACELADTEPCDHIGYLLMLAAWLAQSGQTESLDQLLSWHLLPWSGRFLDVFVENAGHPFYCGLGQLAQLTLRHWQAGLVIPVANKPLFM